MLPGKGSCVETCDYTKVYDGASWEVAETTLACGYHLIVITSLIHCNRADRVLAKYFIDRKAPLSELLESGSRKKCHGR